MQESAQQSREAVPEKEEGLPLKAEERRTAKVDECYTEIIHVPSRGGRMMLTDLALLVLAFGAAVFLVSAGFALIISAMKREEDDDE